MDSPSKYLVPVSKLIDADRQRLFDIVADPAQHALIDGSDSVKQVRPGAPARLSLGAKFSMDMRLGANYRVTNTVVEFDEPNVIAWRHFNGHIWRYTFTAMGSQTEVTEQWDARPARRKWLLLLIGFPQRNRAGMTETLNRLSRLAASPA